MTIRHNCETHGCYIKKMTPNWGFLDSSFSGKITVGDIDGIVEANGKLLILEWKSTGATLPDGQEIMFKKSTKGGNITVIVIWGDPEETVVSHCQTFSYGKKREKIEADENKIKEFCVWWEARAINKPKEEDNA